MEVMFKLWTATQVTTGVPGTTHITNREKKKRKWGPHCIENDLLNNKRTKRQYLDSTNYRWSNGYGISLEHDSGCCKKKIAKHNETATITNMLGRCTTNCFHHKA